MALEKKKKPQILKGLWDLAEGRQSKVKFLQFSLGGVYVCGLFFVLS